MQTEPGSPSLEQIEGTIMRHVEAVFETRVSPETGFLENGGDSIHAIELLFRIEADFPETMEPESLYEVESFRELARTLLDGLRSSNERQPGAGA